jgi:hypothetical protein
MLIRLIISPADENRSGANQMRQHPASGNISGEAMRVLILFVAQQWSLDLSHRKTRSRHPQSNEEAQEAFKKEGLP